MLSVRECEDEHQHADKKYELIEKIRDYIEEGAANLCKLESLLEEHEMKLPSFKMVLTGTELAYQRDDVVYVIPIGCLGP